MQVISPTFSFICFSLQCTHFHFLFQTFLILSYETAEEPHAMQTIHAHLYDKWRNIHGFRIEIANEYYISINESELNHLMANDSERFDKPQEK